MKVSDFLNAEVITAAASSALGIIALVVLILAFVALVFFRRDGPAVRLSVFGVLVVVCVGLSATAIYQKVDVCSQEIMNWEEYKGCMEKRGD
ncbi:MAG: hypothetical protein GKS00_20195 [Alphaproteobacteria bacterium]|nr:hypothetical protein [Alphaproteobacteria bacterium]